MILEVTQQNASMPVGSQFKLNEKTGMYETMERHEDIGDDYEFVSESHYAFSPSFYANNKEIFNQVKLEETNEKIKIDKGQETKECESDDICLEDKTCDEDVSVSTDSLRERDEREEVAEGSQEGQTKGNSYDQGRYACPEREAAENRKKDLRVARYAEIEGRMNNWYESFNTVIDAFDKTFTDIRENFIQLKKELK